MWVEHKARWQYVHACVKMSPCITAGFRNMWRLFFFYLCLVGFVKGCFAVEREQGNARPHMENICVPDTAFSPTVNVQLEMITSEKPKNTENPSEHMTAGRKKKGFCRNIVSLSRGWGSGSHFTVIFSCDTKPLNEAIFTFFIKFPHEAPRYFY